MVDFRRLDKSLRIVFAYVSPSIAYIELQNSSIKNNNIENFNLDLKRRNTLEAVLFKRTGHKRKGRKRSISLFFALCTISRFDVLGSPEKRYAEGWADTQYDMVINFKTVVNL